MSYCAVQLHRSSTCWFCVSIWKERSRNSWRRVWKEKAFWVPTLFTSGKDAPCIFPGLQSQLEVSFPRFLKNIILITKQINILWVECKFLLSTFKRQNVSWEMSYFSPRERFPHFVVLGLLRSGFRQSWSQGESGAGSDSPNFPTRKVGWRVTVSFMWPACRPMKGWNRSKS